MKLIQRTSQGLAPDQDLDKDPDQGPEDVNLVPGQDLVEGGHALTHLPGPSDADLVLRQCHAEEGDHAPAHPPEINIETGVVDLVHHHGTGIFDVLGAGKGGNQGVLGQGNESPDLVTAHVISLEKERGQFHQRDRHQKKENQQRRNPWRKMK